MPHESAGGCNSFHLDLLRVIDKPDGLLDKPEIGAPNEGANRCCLRLNQSKLLLRRLTVGVEPTKVRNDVPEKICPAAKFVN